MKLLMISTDSKVFEQKSAVRARMISYAAKVEKLLIAIIGQGQFPPSQINQNFRIISLNRIIALFWHPKEDFNLVTSQDPFENGLIAWFLSKRLRAKLELQIHTDFLSPYFTKYSFLNKIRLILAKFLLPKADKIRVVSNRIKDSLITNLRIPESKIEVRPIFVDTENIKNAPITVDLHKKYPQFDKIILMASRLTREKNIGLAIKAMREITKKRSKIGLLIVGTGSEERKLKLQATSYKLQANIVFEFWVNQETLSSYYKTCDLFLVTSLYEGYGMTLVEAQATGCPIISTDVGVAREVGARIIDHDSLSVAKTVIQL